MSNMIIEMICVVVLNFPDLCAGIITFLVAASERRPVIINSLDIIKTIIHAGILSSFNPTNDISTAEIINLSANGSRNIPIVVTVFLFLAINPSNVSVNAAQIKNIKANILYSNGEIEKIGPSQRKDYYRILLKDILNKNPKGVTVAQIAALTKISKKTISYHLEFLVATRDAYKWEYGPRSIVFFPNGKLLHPIADVPIELGGRYYTFRHIVNEFGDFIHIQEKKDEGGNVFTTVGGIMVRKNALKDFIENLRNICEGE